MNESLLFGVRVRRVFVVLRLLHSGCNHEEQPGTVQQNNLKQREDHQNNKNRSNHRVPCIIIFCNGIQVGTLCIDFLNFSSKKSLTMLSVHDKITFDFERQSMAESFQSNLPWTAQRG